MDALIGTIAPVGETYAQVDIVVSGTGDVLALIDVTAEIEAQDLIGTLESFQLQSKLMEV